MCSGEVQEQLAAAKQGKPQAPLDFVRRARREGSHLPRSVVIAFQALRCNCTWLIVVPIGYLHTHQGAHAPGPYGATWIAFYAMVDFYAMTRCSADDCVIFFVLHPRCWICRYSITDKVPKAGHPDWKRVVAVIVMVRELMRVAPA